jgi:metallo-beta-lactamase family protein
MDSGRLQEEEVAYRIKHVGSKHQPPLPLYTEEDVKKTIPLFKGVPWATPIAVAPGIEAQWIHAGHMLGAASIQLTVDGKTITFSGDLGRFHDALCPAPSALQFGEAILIESTYGNRLHPREDVREGLERELRAAWERKGILLVPSFAIGRAQQLLFLIKQLQRDPTFPRIPIFVDSPMARDATGIYSQFQSELSPEVKRALHAHESPFSPDHLQFIGNRQDSKRLNDLRGAAVIIAASGMITGGRILHHLLHRLGDPRTTVLFVGFQPPGGRGAELLGGAESIRLFHQDIAVRARMAELSGLSAHADKSELLQWVRSGEGKPDKVYVVHGEPESAESFAKELHTAVGWNAAPAAFHQVISV